MNIAPLSKGFMVTAILGILISTMFLPEYSITWAFTLGIISFVMFIAAVISMTYAPVEDELALDRGSFRIVKPHNEDITLFGRKTDLKKEFRPKKKQTKKTK